MVSGEDWDEKDIGRLFVENQIVKPNYTIFEHSNCCAVDIQTVVLVFVLKGGHGPGPKPGPSGPARPEAYSGRARALKLSVKARIGPARPGPARPVGP